MIPYKELKANTKKHVEELVRKEVDVFLEVVQNEMLLLLAKKTFLRKDYHSLPPAVSDTFIQFLKQALDAYGYKYKLETEYSCGGAQYVLCIELNLDLEGKIIAESSL